MSRMSPEVLHLPAPVTRLLAPRVSRPRRSVVIGGGIAGVAAATVLCERGVDVTLIEREPLLGEKGAEKKVSGTFFLTSVRLVDSNNAMGRSQRAQPRQCTHADF